VLFNIISTNSYFKAINLIEQKIKLSFIVLKEFLIESNSLKTINLTVKNYVNFINIKDYVYKIKL